MKQFLKMFLIVLSVLLILQCERFIIEEPDDVPDPIDSVNIPDTSFLYALFEEGVDTNGDSIISYSEAESIRFIDVSGTEMGWEPPFYFIYGDIKSLAGIEAFVNLDTLICYANYITEMNLEKQKSLKYLDCSVNQLSSLDVSNNTALERLRCFGNQLSSLDVSNNTALERLRCSGNQLSSLNVSNNISLTVLGCASNQLSNLDVSKNILLKYLACCNNKLRYMDLHQNTALKSLSFWNNTLRSLDVSNNTVLWHMECSGNRFTTLDVSNNKLLNHLGIGGMPSLNEVCVWTMPFPPTGLTVYSADSPNVVFTTDCNNNSQRNYPYFNSIEITPTY